MEKVESSKKKKIIESLTTAKSKYVIGTILLGLMGITLPRIFHVLAGSGAGAMFLPMHIAVLIAALVFGATSSSIVAIGSIIFSYLLTGMPTIERLPYMLIELLIYAIILGILNRKFSKYISLIFTMIIGRIIYASILFAAANLLGLQTYGISVIESVKIGYTGIIVQLICIPFIAVKIQKGLKINE